MNEEIKHILKEGGVGVIPTDTIYGMVGSALKKATVERIYKIRNRASSKPMIILIPSIKSLEEFNISLSDQDRKILERFWPNKVSVILNCNDDRLEYLHRGTYSLAFRIPKDEKLLELLQEVGPLVAPSVNPAGRPPAKNIGEAKRYFGDRVDFYIDKGDKEALPSTLIRVENGKLTVLRKGDYVPKNL